MSELFNTGVRPHIDNWLLEEAKKRRDYGNYWSASSAGFCMRKVMLDRLQIPYVIDDPRKQRVFTAGHLFHEWIQRITKEAGLSVAQEIELIDDDIMVKGHFDDLVLIPGKVEGSKEGEIEGQKYYDEWGTVPHLILYDYKTRNSRSFNYAKQPSEYHEMQLGTYMYMLRKQNNHGILGTQKNPVVSLKDLTEARTLNIEKDTLRMAEVQYMWTPALEKKVYGYWSTLNGYWEAKTIPRCSCQDFMKMERYNPFYFAGEPCSEAWFKDKLPEGWRA